MKLSSDKLSRTLKQTKYLTEQFIKLFGKRNSREQNYIISKTITSLLEIERNILELRTLVATGLTGELDDK